MAELIFFVIAIICLISDAVGASVFFIGVAAAITAYKRTRLAQKLSDQEELFREAIDSLRREIGVLREQVKIGVARPEMGETRPAVATVASHVPPQHPTTQPVAPAQKPAVAASVTHAPEAPTQVPVMPKPQVPVEPKPMETRPTVAPPVKPVEPVKPVAPTAPQWPKPVVPPVSSKPTQAPVPAVAQSATAVPPRVAPPPAPAQASHTTPPVFAPMRSTYAPEVPKAPSKPFSERLKSALALEEVLGTNWLNKIGIIILVLGMALLGIYQFNRFGAPGKTFLTVATGLALLIGGVLFEKRERYKVLGRTGIGGGWALLFFTAYAVGHVDAMRLLSSDVTDALLMLGVAAAMGAHTLRYRSQLVTGMAFLLGYSTIALSQDTVYSLSAGAVLAITLVVLVVKLNWYELEIFGILSSYLNHFYWLYKLFGDEGATHKMFPEYYASTAILLVYWVCFRSSYVIRKIRDAHEEHVSTLAALLNTLLLLAVMKFQSARPELAFYALLVLGAIEFALGQLPITKRRRVAFVILSVMGAVLMIAAVPFRYSGANNALLWMAGAEAFLAAGIILKEKVFRRLGLLTGLIAAAPVIYEELGPRMPFANARLHTDAVLVPYGVLFLTLGVVYYLNSQFLFRKWEEQFDDGIENSAMLLHSYLGAAAMSLGAWALLPMDWTVLGWAAIVLVLAYGVGRFDAMDLFLQSGVIAFAIFARAVVLNLRTYNTHSHWLLTIIPVAAAFYLAAKFLSYASGEIKEFVHDLFAAAGTALVALLIWREFTSPWVVLGWAVMALLLLEAARLLKYRMLLWHVHAMAALAVARALMVNVWIGKADRWHGAPIRIATMLIVAAIVYVVAKRVRTELQSHFAGVSAAYTWAAVPFIGTLIYLEVPQPWIAVSWIVFGLALTFIGRRLKLSSLCYQENVLAIGAIIATITFNYELHKAYGHFTLRLITVALVAAGLYVGSRKSSLPQFDDWRPVAYGHTWAATALLAALAYFEFHASWLAMVWAGFALVLTVIDRRFKLSDLRWQSHTLALITAVRAVGWNLYDTTTLRGVSLRLISLAFVVIAFYVMSRIIRMPEEYRRRDIHHIYSWVATLIAGAVIWYELQPQPLAVAVAWGIFGLLLVQSGLMRRVAQLRFQGYVAIAAGFTRIFFSNLTANKAVGDAISPRILTVIPLAMIIFYIYSQLESRKAELVESRFKVGSLFCYAGTIAVSALLYFELLARGEWIVTAWSALVFVLFAIALVLHRNIFLHQALLLSVAAFSRGVFHNLFGGSYFMGPEWTVILGSAIAVLFLTLPFAFRLRVMTAPDASDGKLKRIVAAFGRRPEQVMFFVPFALLTLMLMLKLRAGMVTVAWGVEAILIFIFALMVRERSFRLTGLLLVLVCIGKILIVDIRRLQTLDRIITFIILGAVLITISFLYSRYRETIRQYL